jgi:hypothetical protein
MFAAFNWRLTQKHMGKAIAQQPLKATPMSLKAHELYFHSTSKRIKLYLICVSAPAATSLVACLPQLKPYLRKYC